MIPAGIWAVIPFTPPQYIKLFGPFQLSAHGVAFLVAAIVSLLLTKKRTPVQYHRALEDVIPYMLLGAVIGARGLYFVQQPDLWSQPWKFFTFWEGGLVSYGGMLGAILGFYFYLRWKKLPVALICDAMAPTALVGWGVGRVGCFLSWHNEFGTLSNLPWAFEVFNPVTNTLESRHPVMLYLSICLIAAGVILMKQPTDKPYRVTGLVLMAEGVIRGTLDTWRDYDPDFLVWTSRAACLVIFLWGVALVRKSNNTVIEKNPLPHGEDSPDSGHGLA
jgi:phosphatidylglycerol:prolipoprotein diacylglycerol transferase